MVKLKVVKPLAPEFADVVGDAVNNLRAALDHAGYALAVAAGRQQPKDAYFPIARRPEDFEKVMRGRSKDIPWQFHELFRSMKPYQGGNEFLPALTEIAAADKHAMVTPMAAVAH